MYSQSSIPIVTLKIKIYIYEKKGDLLSYLLLGVGPARDLDDHVQDGLLGIGVEGNVVEGRDDLAILLNVDTVVQSEGLGNLADGVRHGGRCGREMSREKSGSCERRGRKGGRRGVSGGSQRCGCAPNRGGGGRKSQSGQGRTGQSHWLFARGCGQSESAVGCIDN